MLLYLLYLLHGLCRGELLEKGLELIHLRGSGCDRLSDCNGRDWLGLLDDLITEEGSHELSWLLLLLHKWLLLEHWLDASGGCCGCYHIVCIS